MTAVNGAHCIGEKQASRQTTRPHLTAWTNIPLAKLHATKAEGQQAEILGSLPTVRCAFASVTSLGTVSPEPAILARWGTITEGLHATPIGSAPWSAIVAVTGALKRAIPTGHTAFRFHVRAILGVSAIPGICPIFALFVRIIATTCVASVRAIGRHVGIVLRGSRAITFGLPAPAIRVQVGTKAPRTTVPLVHRQDITLRQSRSLAHFAITPSVVLDDRDRPQFPPFQRTSIRPIVHDGTQIIRDSCRHVTSGLVVWREPLLPPFLGIFEVKLDILHSFWPSMLMVQANDVP